MAGWNQERIDQIEAVMERVLESAGLRLDEVPEEPRGWKLSASVTPQGEVLGAAWLPSVPKTYSVLYHHREPASLLTVADIADQIIDNLNDIVNEKEN